MIRLALALVVLALLPAAAHAGEPDATQPAYQLELRGTEGGFRWAGRETVTLTNPGPAPLDEVFLRLWGNGVRGCKPRAVAISNPVGGTLADPTRRNCTAVRFALAAPLAPGARGSISFDVAIRASRTRPDRFGRGGKAVALFSNAIPAIAHREAGAWRLDKWYGAGEAWTYPAARWQVRLDAAGGFRVAAPGVLQPDGSRVVDNGRDYSFAAGKLRSASAAVGGVAVTAWAPAAAPQRRLRRALTVTQQRLPRLQELFGPFGWPDLQVVVTNSTAMEHSALIMTPPTEFILVHELAHEWWFGTVGDDQAQAPWLDEAFATYAEEAVLGQQPWCRRPSGEADLATRGVDFFRSQPFRYGAVYFAGACLLDLLEKRMGSATFRAALRGYAIANRYGWSTAAEFRAAMEAATPRGLGDLWRRFRVQ